MSGRTPTRYQVVSRRAMLKASLGSGAFLLLPGLACGNNDAAVFAGETAAPSSGDGDLAFGSTTPDESTTTSATQPALQVEDTPSETAEAPSDETTVPSTEETTVGSTEQTAPSVLAVAGEMVVSFTYTQGATGKNEPPYIAVWVEDAAGDLVETITLWYEQGRRGERWLDHLSRWWDVDLARQNSGGVDDAATISSATRAPGSYAVVWDGLADGVPVGAGDYFVCIEAVREEGPYSLIREPFTLGGSLAETALPDDGELSLASVRIDG